MITSAHSCHRYDRRRLDAIATRWDAKAQSWDQDLKDPFCHLNEDESYARFLQHVRRLIHARRAFCALNGVIDAGCGTGLVLGEVMSSFAWGVGVDVSRKMIRYAKRKSLGRGRFIIGDCFELSAICPKAGAVLSRGVLLSHYGLLQAGALLRAARAALVPGGFAVFDFLNAPGRKHSLHTAEQKHWFTSRQVRELARRAGFARATVLGEPERRVRLLLAEQFC